MFTTELIRNSEKWQLKFHEVMKCTLVHAHKAQNVMINVHAEDKTKGNLTLLKMDRLSKNQMMLGSIKGRCLNNTKNF